MKIPPTIAESDLNALYRRLVKRYHPDRNAGKSAWAHEMTTRINEAYLTVKEHIHARTTGGVHAAADPAFVRRAARTATDEPRARNHDFHAAFGPLHADVLLGIHTYYLYNLENTHLRSEGTRRLRYRTALRRVRNGAEKLDALSADSCPRLQREYAALFLDFARAFLQNMRIEKHFIPDGRAGNHKAYAHYREGSEILDKAIKHAFFRNDFAVGNHAPESLAVGEHAFITVVFHFSDSPWLPETLVKLRLMECFLKLSVFRKKHPSEIC